MTLPVAVRNIPLPESHLGLLGIGVALQALRPIRLPGASSRPAALVAGVVVGSAVAVIGAATSAAGRVDLAEPSRLVTSGPYALSRHPMYEAWTALYAALALTLRNGWLAVLLPILLALVERETAGEERRLRQRFGARHEAYARRVPRYVVLWAGRPFSVSWRLARALCRPNGAAGPVAVGFWRYSSHGYARAAPRGAPAAHR